MLDLPGDCWGEICGAVGVFGTARDLRRVNRALARLGAAWLRGGDGAHRLFCAGIAFQLGLRGRALNDKLGRRMVEAAAANGDPCADAYCDLEGWGVGRLAPDWARAVRTLEAASSSTTSSCAWSEFLVGYCKYHGYGYSRADQSASVRWYQAAADAGLCVAQNHLALMHMEGEGNLTKNISLARRLLEQAAAQGNCRARYGLAMHDYTAFVRGIEDGIEDPKDDPECNEYADGPLFNNVKDAGQILSLFTMSAQQGHDEAQYQLALFYEMGPEKSRLPLPLDTHEAVKWIKLAAERGPAESTDWYGLATYTLGRFHEQGVGPLSPGNKCDALEWYLRAAKVGSTEALYSVGGYCLYGYAELDADPARAASFFQRAARQGHAQAATDLGVLIELGIHPIDDA